MSDSAASLLSCMPNEILNFGGFFWLTPYSPHARTDALYEPTHASTRHGRPRTNYMDKHAVSGTCI